MRITIADFQPGQEPEWLDVHASVMVDSAAWWTVLHKKPVYSRPVIDLVALTESRIIGFIVIEINSAIIEDRNPAGFVWEFGVHRDFRGKDIGRLLIKEAHESMNSRHGVNKSIWYTQEENAQKYYRKLGMKEIGRHWQFTIIPDQKTKKDFKAKGFDCWNLRGSCSEEDWGKVKKNFNVLLEDETLKPRICVGFEYRK